MNLIAERFLYHFFNTSCHLNNSIHCFINIGLLEIKPHLKSYFYQAIVMSKSNLSQSYCKL